jgi:hypothetical protein
VWGLDLLGPFKKAPGGLTHILVAIDKFTKWIEARPLAKMGSRQTVVFIQDIIFCFGVPNSIIADNDTQFTGEKFMDLYDNNNIRVEWAVVTHPRTNGKVECANDMILQGLKSRILHAQLSTRVRKWAVDVPSILWSLQTMSNRSTNSTPFFMVYGAEAVLPTELQYEFPRVRANQLNMAEKAQKETIDPLKESRDITITRSAGSQHALQRYHAHRVHPEAFYDSGSYKLRSPNLLAMKRRDPRTHLESGRNLVVD